MRVLLVLIVAKAQEVCLLQAGLRSLGRVGAAPEEISTMGQIQQMGQGAWAHLHEHMHHFSQRVDKRTVGWVASIGLGLLASSCCLLQLLVYGLAALQVCFLPVGCYGFNKKLGPAQPYLRAFTLIGMAVAWTGVGEMSTECLWKQTAVCLALMFLPELLRALTVRGLLPEEISVGTEVRILKVDGMGCDACAYAVKAKLETVPGVRAASVDARTGVAEVLLVAREFEWACAVEKLDEAGFDLEVPSASEKPPA